MKLSKYKEDYYFFTGKVSDIVRQLAFAGIAVIWVFKQDSKPLPKIPDAMLLPLALLVLALAADLLQYSIAALIWGRFHRYHEKELIDKTEDPDLTAPGYYNWPALFLIFMKSTLVVIAYILLLRYVLGIWIASV